MSMLQKSIPAPCSKVLDSNDCSDDYTVVTSNVHRMHCTYSLVPDDETVLTQLSTYIKSNASNDDDTSADIPVGTFIAKHALPWGGKSTKKTAARWKRRMSEQAKRRAMKEINNPRFKYRGEM